VGDALGVDHASAHGRKVIAMNVPMTYPPKPVNGIMVSGLWTPESGKFAYPPELREELLSWGYRLDTIDFEPGLERAWLDDTWAVTRSQTDAFARLLRRGAQLLRLDGQLGRALGGLLRQRRRHGPRGERVRRGGGARRQVAEQRRIHPLR
jgi:hypothetical protein